MLQLARDDVGEDLHLAVRVCPESLTGLDAVFVDYTKCAKVIVLSAVVSVRGMLSDTCMDERCGIIMNSRGEAERMECLEPAMIGVATLMRRTRDELDIRILGRRRERCSGGWSRHCSSFGYCCDSGMRGSQRTQATDESARKYVVESDGETQIQISSWAFIGEREEQNENDNPQI